MATSARVSKAGVLVDASGLEPTPRGWRIKYSGKERTLVDGPFTESKEVFAGYAIFGWIRGKRQ